MTDGSPDQKVTSGVTDGSGLGVTEGSPKQIQYKDTSKDNKPTASRQDYSNVEQEYFGGW